MPAGAAILGFPGIALHAGLALARYVLRLPPVVEMHRDVIIRTVDETVQRYASGAAIGGNSPS